MKRKPGNLLRRIEDLETRLTDSSGLVPHSPAWLEYWGRQLHNGMTDQLYVPLTIEAFRAVVRASRDEGDKGDSEKNAGGGLTQ
jgi:hypothetical protein